MVEHVRRIYICNFTSKTTAQLIPALTKVVSAGNEDEDSLKTYIFNGINVAFFYNELDKCKITYQLEHIIERVTKITNEQYKRILPCYAAFFSENSNFHRLPKELVHQIASKLYKVSM